MDVLTMVRSLVVLLLGETARFRDWSTMRD